MDWINLKKQKPDDNQVVLAWWPGAPGEEYEHCCFKARFCHYDKRTKGYFDTAEFEDPYWTLMNQEVTHWMPLPEGPK